MNLPVVTLSKLGESYETTKNLSLVVPVGGIIASLLILALVVWPKVNDILQLRTTNEQLVSRAQNLEKKADILASLDKDSLEDQLAAAEQLLPSDKNTFSILRQVENAFAVSGVLLTKIEVVAATINDGPSKIKPAAKNKSSGLTPSVQIRLSATSDYQSLIQLLSNLYAFSRIVSIDNISLSAVLGESLQVNSSFTVDAYWKTLPENLGSIESPVQKLTQSEEQLLSSVSEPEVIPISAVPKVPIGRSDLFSPF